MYHNGTAHLTNRMEALEARTQTDLQQLEENQSQLAHAYKSIQTNHVPSEVTTEPDTLRSSVTSPASAYFTTNDINTNLETKVAELQKQLEALTRQNQTHQQTRQGSRPAAPQQTNGEHGPSGATPMAPT
jgi:chromosome segregation ATPase